MRKANLPDLVQELKNQQMKKRDLVIPSRCLSFRKGAMIISDVEDHGGLSEILQGTGISTTEASTTELALIGTDTFHQHITEKLGIPKQYYERMANGHVKLLDENVNHWLRNEKKNYLIRSFVDGEEKTGIARAMLSDSFLLLDHYDVLMTVLEVVKESGINLQMDADITEKRMYVRFTAPEIEVQAKELLKNYKVPGFKDQGEYGVCAGFVVGNSEVGHGQFFVAPRTVIKVCNNGMVAMNESIKRIHVGSKMSEYSFIKWSEQTQKKNQELIMLQVRDALKTFLTPEFISEKVRQYSEKAGIVLTHPIDAVKNVSREFKFSQEKEKAILDYFFESGDSTRFGLVQAVTLFAHKDTDADDQFDLESMAPVLIDKMPSFDKPFIDGKK